MKALTVRQPYASLIAVGAKSIETRSWSTSYRGPLVIHAGATRPHRAKFGRGRSLGANDGPGAADIAVHTLDHPSHDGRRLCWCGHEPIICLRYGLSVLDLGAVVASCVLADVVPTIHCVRSDDPGFAENPLDEGQAFFEDEEPGVYVVRASEWDFGDFTPGRHAWLLEDVKPTTDRCPACWGKGTVIANDVPGHDYGGPAWRRGCPACARAKVCDPIPAKGRQGLWNWEA